MRDLVRKLNHIFDRSAKKKLALATLGSTVVAFLDTVAIALVLPLVDLATGASLDSGPSATLQDLLGIADRGTLLVVVTSVLVGLFIVKDLGSLWFIWWSSGFVARERVKTSTRLLRHFLVSPYTEVSRRSSSDLIRTMNDSVAHVFNLSVTPLMNLVTNGLAMLAVVTALVLAAPLITAALVVYFGLAALLYLWFVKPRALAAGRTMNEVAAHAWKTAFAALGGIKELHLRGTQEHFLRRYQGASLEASLAGRTSVFLSAIPRYALEILFILAVGVILVLGSNPTFGAGSSVGVLALFVAAGFRILPAVTGFLGSMSAIRSGTAALDLVHAELMVARQTHATPVPNDAPPLPLSEALRVEDLSFRYPDANRDVLRDISLTIPRGSSAALVGGSGAGKTTLVDLVLGLHEPTAGRITADGVDTGQHRRQWQQNIGYVPQDVYVLDATLAENIAFDRDRADIDDVLLWSAIRAAQLEDLVAELPDGVDTPLGEKGTRLSGGQRQRVGIARALYRQPELLVLDEATSALDNETENRISQTIRQLHGRVTVILVAHRLSTVRNADQLLFLKAGEVAARGTFDDVRRGNADFARLVELGSLEGTAPPVADVP